MIGAFLGFPSSLLRRIPIREACPFRPPYCGHEGGCAALHKRRQDRDFNFWKPISHRFLPLPCSRHLRLNALLKSLGRRNGLSGSARRKR